MTESSPHVVTSAITSYGGISMLTQIEQGLTKNPHSLAVISQHQLSGHLSDITSPCTDEPVNNGCLAWTYTQLFEAALRLALGLRIRSIPTNSAIVTFIPNRVEWALFLWASTIHKLNFGSLDHTALQSGRQQELRGYLTVLRPTVAVVVRPEDYGQIYRACDACGVEQPLVVVLAPTQPVSDEASRPWVCISELAAFISPSDQEDRSIILRTARRYDPERTAVTLFTSGTTSGRPKGCLRHVQGSTFVTDAISDSFRLAEDACRFLHMGVNYRVSTVALSLSTWKCGGATVISGDEFTAESALRAIERYAITHMFCAPSLFHALEDHPAFPRTNLTPLRYVLLGGEIISKERFMHAAKVFPGAKIAIGHGMTECSGTFVWPFFDSAIEDIPFRDGIAPVGYVLPGQAIRIWDLANDRLAQADETGELQICSPALIKDYVGVETVGTFIDDPTGRWFKTGDIAVMNEVGLVWILGRLNDRIKRGGCSITPAAIEACIEEYVGTSACVFGMEHATLGEDVYAVVEQLHGKTRKNIAEHVLVNLGKDYALGRIFILEELGLDVFPTNATGKKMKGVLKSDVMRYLASKLPRMA